MSKIKGIKQQMEEKETLSIGYSSEGITREILEKVITETFAKPRRQMIIHTGQQGMFMFQWAMMFGDTLEVKHFRNSFKKLEGQYYSLFTKHGKYKLYILGRTFTVYEGTKIIKVFTDVQNSELLDFKVFEKPEVHKANMKKINNYLKGLENGRK